MQFTAVIVVLLCLCLSAVAADSSPVTMESLKKMNMKKLRVFLFERGEDCVGCAEKDDFVAKAFAVKDKEIVPTKKVPDEDKYENPGDFDSAKIEELMRNSGMNAKMFTADDLKDLSAEDLEAKLGGMGGGRSSKGRSKGSSKGKSRRSGSGSGSKARKEEAAAAEDEVDHMEL